jgi:Flp pilus assembly protein TadD
MADTSEDRRVILDLVLAGCICLTAICYWLWETKTTAGAVLAPLPKPPMAITEAEHLTRNPFNDEGYRLFAAENYVGAETQFRKAIGANPKAALGFCNLGAALIAQRRYDEAIAALRTASALDPALALAQNNLNWALEEKAKTGK